MQRISSILSCIIKTFGLESNLQLRKLFDSWVQIVGDTIALHSSPERLRQGILYVAVDSPIWMQQLSFFKKDLIEKVNGAWSMEHGARISDIRFVIRDVKIQSQCTVTVHSDSSQTPTTDTDEKMAEVEEAVAAINDREIKEGAKKMITKALSCREKR
ncbi:MAG: DUF721 domain-containing protein [Nitrospirota bacterium]